MFPSIESAGRRFALLHLSSRASSQLRQYYQSATTSYCSSRRTSFPSLGDTSATLVSFSPRRTSTPPRPGFVNPGSPSGMLPRKQQDFQSSGEPLSVCTWSKPTPAGLIAPDHKVQQRGSWFSKGKDSHDWVFRRTIAWFSDSLFTLRRADHPTSRKTRFQLLVRFTGRDSHPQGSRALTCTSSPYPSFDWRN